MSKIIADHLANYYYGILLEVSYINLSKIIDYCPTIGKLWELHLIDPGTFNSLRFGYDVGDKIISFIDANEVMLQWLYEHNFERWDKAILQDLHPQFYKTVLNWSINPISEHRQGFVDWICKPNDVNIHIYIKLREHLSWAEIAEYFGFTKIRRHHLKRPGDVHKNTKYYDDFYCCDKDLIYVSNSCEIKRFNQLWKPVNVCPSELHWECTEEWREYHEAHVLGLIRVNFGDQLRLDSKKALSLCYKYAAMTMSRKLSNIDLNNVIMQYAAITYIQQLFLISHVSLSTIPFSIGIIMHFFFL